MHRPQEVARLLQPPVVSIPEIVNEEPKETPVLETPKKMPQQCKKCGREFVRGVFIHEKYCKGK